MIRHSCFAFGILMAAVTHAADVSTPSLVEGYLSEGRLAPAAKALVARISEDPSDAEAQYGLGIVRLLQAVEGLAQNLHRYGLRSTSPQLPFVRLPVPENPNPEELTYGKWRGVLEQFNGDLNRAAAALAKVDDPHVKLRLPVGMIRLDLDGDGTAGPDETFWRVFTRVAWRAAKLSDDQKRFPIGFDAADVHWMIGYTHLLRAMTEAWLAYDTEGFFRQTAHLFFAGVESPYQQLGVGRSNRGFSFNMDQIADAVAAIHLAHFEPADPRRLSLAREHLLAMIEQSRLCWKHALAETDDDREWIPNAKQTSLTPLTVNDERIAAWKRFLDEADAVLQGDKLLPHWRVKDGRGINLKRVFEEPRTFDLVLWVHGAAAVPYLEDGELVTAETARSLNAAFQGRFLAFAVWFQ
jgi:hypothetical protein